MEKFEITTRTNGEFQFNLKAANGQIILSSAGYSTKASCTNSIESVRTNAQDDSRFDRLTAKNDSPYFNLKAANGQIIGTSQMYQSIAARDNGIASVASHASKAIIDDQTN